MAIYAIGDIQGCYDALRALLDKIRFDPLQDRLWLCGDLVNRGAQSLQVLRFLRSLGDSAISVLGNHDLHLLALYHRKTRPARDDSLYELLNSADCDELMHWLQARPMLHYDAAQDALLVHAGVHPAWSLDQAMRLAGELQQVLRGDSSREFLQKMYGDQPDRWSDQLQGMARWRCITNVFTRMRFFDTEGRLDMDAKGAPGQHAEELLRPWFDCEASIAEHTRIIFGHWSTLVPGRYGRAFALDGGCVWGGQMVALRVDSAPEEWIYHLCED